MHLWLVFGPRQSTVEVDACLPAAFSLVMSQTTIERRKLSSLYSYTGYSQLCRMADFNDTRMRGCGGLVVDL